MDEVSKNVSEVVSYVITSPEGNVYVVGDIKGFCQSRGITQKDMKSAGYSIVKRKA